jgi:hypothetical protein
MQAGDEVGLLVLGAVTGEDEPVEGDESESRLRAVGGRHDESQLLERSCAQRVKRPVHALGRDSIAEPEEANRLCERSVLRQAAPMYRQVRLAEREGLVEIERAPQPGRRVAEPVEG